MICNQQKAESNCKGNFALTTLQCKFEILQENGMSLFATHLQKNASAIAGLVEDLQSNGILLNINLLISLVVILVSKRRKVSISHDDK